MKRWWKRHWKKVMAGLCLVLIVGLAWLTIYFKDIYNPQNLFGDTKPPSVDEPSDYDTLLSQADLDFLKNRVNILLLGIDSDNTRANSNDLFRTDTVMLCTINFDTKKVDIISIPRDSYVVLASGGKNKINAAFPFGGGLKGNGFQSTMATVQKLAGGIPIDYYVAVDMNGLYTVVEGIGGADVNVEAEYVHCTFDKAHNNCGTQHELGVQHLDGYHFLSYVRQRKGSSDVARAGRQQRAIVDVVKQLKKSNMLTQVTTLYNTFVNDVYTNLDIRQLAALAVFAMDLDMENGMATHTVPGDFLNLKSGSTNISYWGINQTAWKQMVKEIFGVDIKVDMSMDVSNIKSELQQSQQALLSLISSANGEIESANSTMSSLGEYMTAEEKSRLSGAIASCSNAVDGEIESDIRSALSDLRSIHSAVKTAAQNRKASATPTPRPTTTPSADPSPTPGQPTPTPSAQPTPVPSTAPTPSATPETVQGE